MVTITLYMRQQKRHRCIEQSYGLCGRGRGWNDLGEWHWNMYIIICEMNRQSRFDAGYRMLGALQWDDPDGWYGEGGGRGVQDGEHVYTMVDSFWCMAKPIQYCKVKKKKKRQKWWSPEVWLQDIWDGIQRIRLSLEKELPQTGHESLPWNSLAKSL